MKRRALLILAVGIAACRTWGTLDGRRLYLEAKAACNEGGDMGACAALAHGLIDGYAEQALPYATKACSAGNTRGCYVLANLIRDGYGPPDAGMEFAKVLYANVCDAGMALGCNNLGAVMPELELSMYERACDGGVALGCANLGHTLSQSREPSVMTRALWTLSAACDAGAAAGCYYLGNALVTGALGPRDVDAGLHLLSGACAAHDATACFVMGDSYDAGTRYFRVGCRNANAAACRRLGVDLFRAGRVEDRAEMTAALKDACRLRDADACDWLIYTLGVDTNTRSDVDRGRSLAEETCLDDSLGNDSCRYAGVLNIDGGYLRWWERAIRRGNGESVELYRLNHGSLSALCDAGVALACVDGG